MTIWSTRTIDTNRIKNYVVIKHRIRGINGTIHGVKFRDGYGVVDKNTKRYNQLVRFPELRNAQEFPLSFLRKLKFVTRTNDIKTIWGQDVYYYYIKDITEVVAKEKEESKQEAEKAHVEESDNCNFRTKSGQLCKREALEKSPAGYCAMHILQDEQALVKVDIKLPGMLTKEDKKTYREKVMKKLDY